MLQFANLAFFQPRCACYGCFCFEAPVYAIGERVHESWELHLNMAIVIVDLCPQSNNTRAGLSSHLSSLKPQHKKHD